MRRVARWIGVLALLSGGATVVDAPPAGAAVIVATSGTVMTATVDGDAYLSPSCDGDIAAVILDGSTTFDSTPPLPCSAMTKAVIDGDAGRQHVYGGYLDGSPFSAHPSLTVHLADGNDDVIDTGQADALDMGAGDDTIQLGAGSGTNTTNDLGTGTYDTVKVEGSDLGDTISVASTSTNASFTLANSDGSHTNAVTAVDQVQVRGYAGNDTIDATGVTAASAITGLILDGGFDVNTVSAGPKVSNLSNFGGSGTMNGGAANDVFYSENTADVMHGGGGADIVYDDVSLHSGGRSFDTTGTATWDALLNRQNDVVARVRPGATAGSSTLVVSLDRSGIQQLPAQVDSVVASFDYSGHRDQLGLFDAVLPAGGQRVSGYGDSYANDVVDITIPSGTWTTEGSMATTYSIHPANPAYGQVDLQDFGASSVHGPWTANRNAGFAHRATRDLVFRFLTPSQRNSIAASLASGSKTRLAVAHDLIFSDEYRGLDVDRIFRRFLKRQADPGGRSYWIAAMRDGRSLRKFRAQLFASNEYFKKAGGTNAGFVNAAYFDVLGRLPDPSGLTYWVHKLDTGTSRSTVANTYLGSTEARRTIVKEQFLRFLDRYPTTDEVDAWMEPLRVNATGEQDLIAFLAASNSYYVRS